jgi:hypothetical protein
MPTLEELRMIVLQAICYSCGCSDFSIEDVREAQPEELKDDVASRDLICKAICPRCGESIEI